MKYEPFYNMVVVTLQPYKKRSQNVFRERNLARSTNNAVYVNLKNVLDSWTNKRKGNSRQLYIPRPTCRS